MSDLARPAHYTNRAEAVLREIIEPLGEHAADFDIEAIAADVLGDFSAGYALAVDEETFWGIAERHATNNETGNTEGPEGTAPQAAGPLTCPAWCDHANRHPFDDLRPEDGRLGRTHEHALPLHRSAFDVWIDQAEHLDAATLDPAGLRQERPYAHLIGPQFTEDLTANQLRELAATLTAAADLLDTLDTSTTTPAAPADLAVIR